MGSLENAMEKLTSQWYNAVVNGCGLDPNTFQLVQGSQVIGTTSQQMWQFFDAVPPLSISNFYNPTSFNKFSQDYGGVINNLFPQNSDALASKMGDYYSEWLQYAKKNGSSLESFQKWTMDTNPSQAPTWISLYRTLLNGAIIQAQLAWTNMLFAAKNKGICGYNRTINDLNQALLGTASKTVHMDSSKESSSCTNTWAKGNLAGAYDWFFGDGNASYSSLSETLVSSDLTIDAKFDNFLTFNAAPLSQPSNDPTLSQFTPWFNSSALNMAYKNNNNRVWQHGAPTWDNTFGEDGNMQRVCGAIIVVDGISIEVTSGASISKNDQAQFKAAASVGFFPFFEANVSSGWDTKTTFDDDGHATMTMKSPTGNPQVLGVIVTPIDQAF